MRQISYGIDLVDGGYFVFSRLNGEIMYPVLDFEHCLEATIWNLEKFPNMVGIRDWFGTRKVPFGFKNQHRKAWGFPPVKFKSGDVLDFILDKDDLKMVKEQLTFWKKYAAKISGASKGQITIATEAVRAWVYGRNGRVGWVIRAYIDERPKVTATRKVVG